MLWPRSQSLSAMCPPCVTFVSALAAPPNLVRHMSALCQLCVRFGGASKPCPPCVRLLPALCPPCVHFGRASKPRVCHIALCVRHVSACLLLIRSLSAFVWVYGLALAEPLSSSVFALWSLRLCLFLAVPLPAVRLVTFSRQRSCLPERAAAHLHPVFCLPPLSGISVFV